ncbi:signal peptidase I [Neobacillus sp. MM2021_6]|uniref:signal peptidase I n=1 Tax=Bacillaceae TaxID=186817 RepID=UPI001407A94A|nr:MULTISPECIES: signal peptidase I [Bacillaceae]MBO0962829.1 signal peptidase I [Neobacillus sp. MM2021_6]NHC20980.1 signal peptidase I [Bacillus sp. MM2020_4]
MNLVKKSLKNWIPFIVTVVIMAFVINKFLFFEILVPSGSMYPTIKPNDRIITTRIHNVKKIKRGEILVFYSNEYKETMVKRVIGLPNDSVEIKENGSVFINGHMLDETYVKYPDNRSGKFKVPNGKYLFLGDYRQHSLDSRLWKDPFISEKNIKGKAVFIVFPFNRASILR